MTPEQLRQEARMLMAQANELERPEREKLDALLNRDTSKMSKSERIELTWQLPPLTDSLMDVLEENGFMSGSSVYTDIENPPDIDWVVMVPPHVFEKHSLKPNNDGYWNEDGFSSIYCHDGNKIYNILCMSRNDLFDAWAYATQAMVALKNTPMRPAFTSNMKEQYPFQDAFATKWMRVRIFRAIKDVFLDHTPLEKRLSREDAGKRSSCRVCGEEAVNFTCKAAREHWQGTAIGECCSGETY